MTRFLKPVCFVLALAAFQMISGCAPKTEAGPETADEGEAVETVESSIPKGVILTEASLYELKDGKAHWKASLNAADTVIWKGEKEELVRSDGQKRSFYRVDMDGDYWVQDYAIAGPAEPAVIIAAETVLYAKPDLTSPLRSGTVSLPRYSIAALLPDDDVTDGFVRISARLEGAANPQISERYVKVETVSTDPNDVGAVKLARIASGTENPVVRKELLKNAIEMARRGRFLSAPAHDEGGRPLPSRAEASEEYPAFFELILTNNVEFLDPPVNYLVTAGTVNVRDIPSVGGQSRDTLEQGATFYAAARTKREVSLKVPEGETAPKGVWLWADGGGWIFGAYAVPNPAY